MPISHVVLPKVNSACMTSSEITCHMWLEKGIQSDSDSNTNLGTGVLGGNSVPDHSKPVPKLGNWSCYANKVKYIKDNTFLKV